MSDIEDGGPKKRELTQYQKDVRRVARRKAEAQGIDWKTLSKEDRKQIKTEVREEFRAARKTGTVPRR